MKEEKQERRSADEGYVVLIPGRVYGRHCGLKEKGPQM